MVMVPSATGQPQHAGADHMLRSDRRRRSGSDAADRGRIGCGRGRGDRRGQGDRGGREDATLEHRVGSVRVGLQVEGGAAGGGSRGVGAANAGDQIEGEERSGVEIRAGRGSRGDVPEGGGNGDEADDGDVRDCP